MATANMVRTKTSFLYIDSVPRSSYQWKAGTAGRRPQRTRRPLPRLITESIDHVTLRNKCLDIAFSSAACLVRLLPFLPGHLKASVKPPRNNRHARIYRRGMRIFRDT
jgi:hypothetical protein